MSSTALRHAAVALVIALLGGSIWVAPVAAADGTSGYRVLDGAQAAAFRVPADVRLVQTWTDPVSGLRFDRYQQHAQPLGIVVDGAQLNVVSRGRKVVLVMGRHYPGVRASLRPRLAGMAAAAIAARHAPGIAGRPVRPEDLRTRGTELRLDARDGRLFYLVESAAPGVRVFHEIDATTGAVIDAWDAIHAVEPGMGTGIKGDRKSLDRAAGTADDLTMRNARGRWLMQSVDGRFVTRDQRNGLAILSDRDFANDNDWRARSQFAGVDAQYYAALSYDFFRDPARFGFDVLDPSLRVPDSQWCQFSKVTSVVHSYEWDNAFWDGETLNYGDGDGFWTRGYSGAQDIVTHEMGHAVTECRVPLEYHDEPGALNESFSDIMATAAEWHINEPLSSRCRLAPGQIECADWWIGEDVIIGGPYYAFRSLADPALEGQPSHYEDYYTGTDDHGGVHTNSGIPNHAFYLMAQGGRNARCAGPDDPQPDCDVFVPGVGMAHAERIVFAAWGLVTPEATFCEARDATVAAAEVLYPDSVADRAAATLAWRAVGVGACDVPTDFDIRLDRKSVLARPGSTTTVRATFVRANADTAPVEVTLSDASPASASLAPSPAMVQNNNDSVDITLDVPAEAASGVHPILVRASDGSTVREAALVLVVDAQPPQASVDGLEVALNAPVAGSAAPLTVTWQSSDDLSGVVAGRLERLSTEWTLIEPSANGTRNVSVAAGRNEFRALAADAAGNEFTSEPFVRLVSLAQEVAATYSGGWTAASASTAWGGATRYSTTTGAAARFTFTGTDVAWVSPLGPKRGRAGVYIDGQLRGTVNLYAASPQSPRVVFSASGLSAGQHTLKVVVRGTSGHPRVDIDGFIVLAPPP